MRWRHQQLTSGSTLSNMHLHSQRTHFQSLSPVVLVVTCSGVACPCSEEPRFSSDVKYYYPGRRQSRGYGFHRRLSVCLSVCLFFFQYDISKTDASRIIKLDTELFHHESWKPIYFGVKRSKVKVTRHEKSVPVCVLGLL